MTIFKRITEEGDKPATVTAYFEGYDKPVKQADSTHPHFEEIKRGVLAGDESVYDLFDIAAGMMNKFSKVTDRVSYNGSDILWDGDPVHSVIANQVKRALEAGESNYEALAKFWEKLESNPEEHSRGQAYDWLASHDFKITPEGDLVGYKGVYDNGDGTFSSYGTSVPEDKPSAFVNGEPLPPKQRVTQRIGDEVSMPRSEVKHDPNQTCERGLHIATFDYATSFGDTVLEVHVNPRDIVSVPVNAGGRKVRACNYKAVGLAQSEREGGPVLSDDQDDNVSWQGVGYTG